MCLEGRLCLVTGANRGFGLAISKELARAGARLVMVCRDPDRGAKAAELVRACSGSSRVELLTADLSRQAAVRRLAREYQFRHRALHVLIHNAATVEPLRRLTIDGIEITFAVNHLAPFLFTNLLFDQLLKGAPSRVIMVVSAAERAATVDFNNLFSSEEYSAFDAYAQSKLANVLFAQALARRLRETRVSVNCLNPGTARTQLRHTLEAAGGAQSSMRPQARPSAAIRAGRRLRREVRRSLRSLHTTRPWTVENGARLAFFMAAAPELTAVSGRHFDSRGETRTSPQSCDDALAERLWSVSAALTSESSAPIGRAVANRSQHSGPQTRLALDPGAAGPPLRR